MKVKTNLVTYAIMVALLIGGYVVYSQYLTNPISQEFVSWEQGGAEVTTGKVGTVTDLNLKIYSTSLLGYNGNIKIQIKKDVPGTDPVFLSKTIPINIEMGSGKFKEVKVTFTPDVKTGGFNTVKEYFYKIYIGDKAIYDPTESGDRNGLQIADKPSSVGDPSVGVPKVSGVLFNDQPQITVGAGTAITTKVKMTGKGKGTLKLEIRKDYGYGLPDGDSYVIYSKDATIDGDGVFEFPQWNAISHGIGFREYFARVSYEGSLIYDPQSPSEREFVKVTGTSGGSTGGGGGTTPTGSVILKSVQWNLTPNGYSKAKITFAITGTVSKTVTADIRQDIPYSTDKNLQSVNINIAGIDKEVSYDVGFISPSSESWVFVRVKEIYDETNPDSRKSQGTEVQVSGTTTNPPPSTTFSLGITWTNPSSKVYNGDIVAITSCAPSSGGYVYVLDTKGVTMMKEDIPKGGCRTDKYTIDSNLPRGVYTVKVAGYDDQTKLTKTFEAVEYTGGSW